MAGKGSGFPNLSLGHFSVAQHDVPPGRALIHFCANRQAGSYRQSLPERPRRGVHTWNARSGMALQLARKFAQCHDSRFRNNSGHCECSVEHRRGAPLRKHETITVWRIWIFGVELHCVKKGAGYKLRGGHARGRVARTCRRRRHHGKNAESVGLFLNRIDGRCRWLGCFSRTQKTLPQRFNTESYLFQSDYTRQESNREILSDEVAYLKSV